MEINTPIQSPNNVSMTGLDTSRAIANKWIGFIPLQNALGNKFRNLELSLVRFSIPSIQMGTSTTSFKGVSYEVPTHVLNPDTKEITFEYKVSQDWYNYKSLFIWASALAILNPVDAKAFQAQIMHEDVVAATRVDRSAIGVFTDLLDCRVWLLNNFKQRVVDFTFHNCFIKSFGEIALDYSSTDEVIHSFTMAYSNFTIDSVGVLKNG